jgi:hypothetical protein
VGSWDKTILLTDDFDPKGISYPTKTNIIKRLNLVADFADPGDTVFVFFSGHGISDSSGEYVLPVDVDINDLKGTAINTCDLVKPFAEAGIKNVVLALDACRENVVRTKGLSIVGISGKPAADSAYKAAVTIYSTKPGWYSYETKDTKESVFTHFLIQGLSGAASNSSTITIGDITSWIPSAVADYALDMGIKQKPIVVVNNPDINSVILITKDSAPYKPVTPSDSSASPTTSTSATTDTHDYKIGDKGPGGGIVFYDKGKFTSGWRYMEVSPEDLDTSIMWWKGDSGAIPGANGAAIGTGLANTKAIVSVQGDGVYAAWVCMNYNGGGESDWFLPSRDELNRIFISLQQTKKENIAAKQYWSSTLDSWGVNLESFSNGAIGTDSGKSLLCIRAVRMF